MQDAGFEDEVTLLSKFRLGRADDACSDCRGVFRCNCKAPTSGNTPRAPARAVAATSSIFHFVSPGGVNIACSASSCRILGDKNLRTRQPMLHARYEFLSGGDVFQRPAGFRLRLLHLNQLGRLHKCHCGQQGFPWHDRRRQILNQLPCWRNCV